MVQVHLGLNGRYDYIFFDFFCSKQKPVSTNVLFYGRGGPLWYLSKGPLWRNGRRVELKIQSCCGFNSHRGQGWDLVEFPLAHERNVFMRGFLIEAKFRIFRLQQRFWYRKDFKVKKTISWAEVNALWAAVNSSWKVGFPL
jgi:hypothetical protein